MRRLLLLHAAGLWAATRVAFAVLTVGWLLALPEGRHVSHDALRSWLQWDTGWYIVISRSGYFSTQSAGFFPLYPLLIAVLGAPFGTGDLARLMVGLAISNLAALGAFLAIALIASQEDGGELPAGRSLRMLAAYPFAVFLAAAYTDALFLALAAFAIYFARRGGFRRAAGLAFLAALARPTGVVLILPLLWELGRRHGWRLRRHLLPTALLLAAAVPLAYAVLAAYFLYRFGDPLQFLHSQERYWGHTPEPPWVTVSLVLTNIVRGHSGLLLLEAGTWLAFAAVLALGARRLPVSFTLYTAGLLVAAIAAPIVTTPDVLYSAGRYLTAAFPVFLVLGRWTETRPWLDLGITASGFMLEGLFTVSFLSGGDIH
ncbi:MAG: hypothetical protein E6I70_08950 [Chloroflexi bacterium]|nr:MAG: hypothetical protein E6I70_08950 [Chloroflexota bacterium]